MAYYLVNSVGGPHRHEDVLCNLQMVEEEQT